MTDKNNIKSESINADKADASFSPSLKDWNIGKIFWGLLLVLIGGLALANNFGYIEVNFGNLWRLWPLLIIAAGISVLSLRNSAGRMIAFILSIITLSAVAWVMLGNFPSASLRTYNIDIQKTSDIVRQVEVSIKAGASSLQIGTVNGNSVAEVKLESNIASLIQASKLVGDNQQIDLSMNTKKSNRWFMGDVRNIWDIKLSKDLPLTLNIDAGASSSDIDMSNALLRSLVIKTGASSMTVKLGDKENLTNLSVESGVSSIVIKIPKSSAVQLKLENGLTSNNLADLVKVGENRYESPGYNQATKKVNITSKIGLSSFSIQRY